MDQPPLELVNVLEVQDSFALRLATSALEDAGIAYVVSGEQPADLRGLPMYAVGEVPLLQCRSAIQVSSEDAARARELLEPLLHPEPMPPADE